MNIGLTSEDVIQRILTQRQLTQALDNGKFASEVFLDSSKAFDTVNHATLREK